VPSPNLQIADVPANSANPWTPTNTAVAALDRAGNDDVSKVISGSTAFSTAETRENRTIVLTGTPGAPFTVDMPDTNRRELNVVNETDAQATIQNSAGGVGAKDAIVIQAGQKASFHYLGVDFYSTGSGAGGGGSVQAQDEGALVLAAASAFNFVGGGVTVSDQGGDVARVSIPGDTWQKQGPEVFLDEYDLTGLSTLTISNLGDPSSVVGLRLEIQGATFSDDDARVSLQVTKNGELKTSGDYWNARFGVSSSDANDTDGAQNNSAILLQNSTAAWGTGNAADEIADYRVWVEQPHEPRVHHFQSSSAVSSPTPRHTTQHGSGSWRGTDLAEVLQAITLIASAGTWTGGKVLVYARLAQNVPAIQVGVPGPLKFLGSYDLAGQSDVPITDLGDGSVKKLIFEYTGVTVSGDDVQINMTVVKNGSEKTAATYSVANKGVRSDDTENIAGGAVGSGINLVPGDTGWRLGNASPEKLEGTVEVASPHESGLHLFRVDASHMTPATLIVRGIASAVWRGADETAPLEAVHIKPSAGTFAAGTVRVYGVLDHQPVVAPGGTPGPWRFLNTHNLASLSSQLINDWVGLSGVTEIMLKFRGVTVSDDGAEVTAQITKNATLKTDANYSRAFFAVLSNDTNDTNGSNTSTLMNVTQALGNAAGEIADVCVLVSEPNAARVHIVRVDAAYVNLDGNQKWDRGSYHYDGADSAAVLDAITFSLSAGTFVAGNVDVFALFAEEPGTPYNVPGIYVPAAPANDQVVLSHVFTRDVDFPVDMAGSQFEAQVAATASTVFDVQKNGVSVGTATFAISGTTATWDVDPAVSFAPGDRLQVIAPSSADATLADLDINLAGVTSAIA
jgi:hypothetical protein